MNSLHTSNAHALSNNISRKVASNSNPPSCQNSHRFRRDLTPNPSTQSPPNTTIRSSQLNNKVFHCIIDRGKWDNLHCRKTSNSKSRIRSLKSRLFNIYIFNFVWENSE